MNEPAARAGLLRLSHWTNSGRHRVQIELESLGIRQIALTDFDFEVSRQDAEDIRWYLEDFLENYADPAPEIARRIERRLAALGTEFFERVFDNADAQRLWYHAQERLEHLRVEVAGEPGVGMELPWELLHDPMTDVPIALRAYEFVRTNFQPARLPQVPPDSAGKALRVLLVICRPEGGDDVPFRSVASHLVRSDAKSAIVGLDLHVLRPPTYAQLRRVLETAALAGQPYDVVHFDGHGVYLDVGSGVDPAPPSLERYHYGTVATPRPGHHGYLIFERPEAAENQELVDGPSLGNLLAQAQVRMLIINACRSAYTEPPAAPQAEVDDDSTDDATSQLDVHGRIRAYGSFGAEVADAGVPGVVAMRYNVYVVTAAQFVGELYAGLLQGQGVGSAVSAARRHLAADPHRQIGQQAPQRLQDWSVPLVFESTPLNLFTPRKENLHGISLSALAQTSSETSLDAATSLPRRPDAGFHGRDATLLALDRAFDTHAVVLLHALAGAGKTCTVAEFARWYVETGGLDSLSDVGPTVLFTSFEQHRVLAQLLLQFGRTFEPLLRSNNIAWDALDVARQRQLVTQIAGQVAFLWIWDNVEPVTGFPSGASTMWTSGEQAELLDFLRELSSSKARVLLTSRREEFFWLRSIPVRIALPPMPMRERLTLAQALAAKQPRSSGRPAQINLDDWRVLLWFSQGNPLTLTVLVGQALRSGLTGKKQLQDFINRLQSGDVSLDDDEREGRSTSLNASLSYGFTHDFTEAERKRLALLHLFRRGVNVAILARLVVAVSAAPADEDENATVDATAGLLSRATSIGLLQQVAKNYYEIHPALPWYFQRLFTTYYERNHSVDIDGAKQAFVRLVSMHAKLLHRAFEGSSDAALRTLVLEEENLISARELSCLLGDLDSAMGCMQGLRKLYRHTGRHVEWERLVEDLGPQLVDATDRALPGREAQWVLYTEYRVNIAKDKRDWPAAERLQRMTLVDLQEWSMLALNKDPAGGYTPYEEQLLEGLAVALETLGHILREQGKGESVGLYMSAIEVWERLGKVDQTDIIAFNLGHAYIEDVPEIQDLDLAEKWYRRTVDLQNASGRNHLSADAYGQLGHVEAMRLQEAIANGEATDELQARFESALAYLTSALAETAPDSPGRLMVRYNQLGALHAMVGISEAALEYYRGSLQYCETVGDRYNAGLNRFNIAQNLAGTGRYGDALLYARASLDDLQRFSGAADGHVAAARRLTAVLEQVVAGTLSE